MPFHDKLHIRMVIDLCTPLNSRYRGVQRSMEWSMWIELLPRPVPRYY